MKRHLNWKIIIASLVAYLATSGTAYADNYNFFFTKPPKKNKNHQPVVSQEEEEASEENSEESEQPEEEKVERTPVVPPPTAAQTSPNTQTVTIPNTQQPIIINNTNNVGYPAPYPNVSPGAEVRVNPLTLDPPSVKSEPAPLPSTSYDLESRSSAAVLPAYQEPNRSNWRMGLSGIMLVSDAKKAYSSYGLLNTYDSSTNSWGGLVTLGWDVTKVIGFNFYGGASHNGDYDKLTPHYGADLQIMPLKIPARNFDIVEFGLLVGASNILSNRDHVGAMHVGAKLNLNFGRDYGFTASTRANVGHYLFEAGFVARI